VQAHAGAGPGVPRGREGVGVAAGPPVGVDVGTGVKAGVGVEAGVIVAVGRGGGGEVGRRVGGGTH
jgi:hypothetical protein